VPFAPILRGTALALAFDPVAPARVLAVTPGTGLVQSADGGETWEPIATDIDGTVRYLAFNPNTSGNVYALTDEDVLYVSTDSGSTWSRFWASSR